MVWLVVQISVWVMVSCCLPKQHLIFPWFTVNKSWFSKDCSMHLHPLSSSTNINFILCLHRKENASFPCGVIRKKAKISTWYKLNMDIIACYIYFFFTSGQFYLSPNWFCGCPSLPDCFPPDLLSTTQDGHLSLSPWGMSVVAVNSADWDRSYSFCSNGKFISVTGVPCHQSVPRTHININGSFACIVQVRYNHHYLLNTNGVPGPDH